MLGLRTRCGLFVASAAIALAACAPSTSSNKPTSSQGGGPAQGSSPGGQISGSGQSSASGHSSAPGHTPSYTVTGTGGFIALIGKLLPGTSDSNWQKLAQANDQPVPAVDMVSASSVDATYSVAFFNFVSVADAASFYANPPAKITGFSEEALGYAPLAGPTGIPAPSKGVDLRSCNGLGSGPSLLPSGQCSDGSASFSIGVATIIQRGSVDVFIAYRVSAKRDHADPADLTKCTTYANDALQALASVGLPN
jgi:hypothetical protein